MYSLYYENKIKIFTTSNQYYYIPEFQEGNQFFYAKPFLLSKKSQCSLVVKSGYSLWAFTNSLDNFSCPYTVVAIPSPESEVKFYQVVLSGKPNFSSYGLEVSEDNIVYMPEKELLNQGEVIPVSSGDWSQSEKQYHAIGAFYYIGIVPSLTSSLFNNPQMMANMEEYLNQSYEMKDSYEYVLSQIFPNVVTYLQFFGFMETSDPAEIKSYKYVDDLLKDQNILEDSIYSIKFAFGNIRHAIARYHTKCFPNRLQSPQVFTPVSYKLLKENLSLVRNLFERLGMRISQESDYSRNSLFLALKQFHKRRKIDETRCGPKTLRSLLFDAALRDDSLLIKAAGFDSKQNSIYFSNNKNHDPNDFQEFQLPTKLMPSRKRVKFINSNLNEYLYEMPNLENEECLLSNSIASTIGTANSSAEILRERIENCEERVKSLSMILNHLSLINNRVTKQLESTGEALNDVLNEHIKVQEKLFCLKGKIASEKRTNKFLMVCAFVIIVSVFVQFIKML